MSKKLLIGLLSIVLLFAVVFGIYKRNLVSQNLNSNTTVSENIIPENKNTIKNENKKIYTFNKNMSGDWITQIDESGIKIIVKNDLLNKNCKEYASNFEECMKMWEDVIDKGISLDSDGRLTTSEEDGSIKILSNISKEEINKNITTNNCVVENEYETEIVLGYSSGVQLISPSISDEYGSQYCDYATNIIFDMTYNKTILIHRSHQDSFLLPNMSVIEFL